VVDLLSISGGGDTGLARTESPPRSWWHIPSRFCFSTAILDLILCSYDRISEFFVQNACRYVHVSLIRYSSVLG
jgi:hypothetical protein